MLRLRNAVADEALKAYAVPFFAYDGHERTDPATHAASLRKLASDGGAWMTGLDAALMQNVLGRPVVVMEREGGWYNVVSDNRDNASNPDAIFLLWHRATSASAAHYELLEYTPPQVSSSLPPLSMTTSSAGAQGAGAWETPPKRHTAAPYRSAAAAPPPPSAVDDIPAKAAASAGAASPRRSSALSMGGSRPVEVDMEELAEASSPRSSRSDDASPPGSPAPAPAPAIAPAPSHERPPRRAAALKASIGFAALAEEAEDEEAEHFVAGSPSASEDEDMEEEASPRPAAKKKAPKQPSASGKKETAAKPGAKPRAKPGEKLQKAAADAAAAAAKSAKEAKAEGLLQDNAFRMEIAKKDAERAADTDKIAALQRTKVKHVKPLKELKPGQHGVAKAPWFSEARGMAARTLPSVATDACGAPRVGWAADLRRDPAQLTQPQRDRRGASTGTWVSREEKDVGLKPPPPPLPPQQPPAPQQPPWRTRFNLPEAKRPKQKQKRAVLLRVRFVDQTPDSNGVVGAAAPRPGYAKRGDVRRAFLRHGAAQRLVWNEVVKLLNWLPDDKSRGQLALDYALVQRMLITKKPHKFKTKADVGTPEYDTAKKAYDDLAAKVEAVRDKHFKGKSLPALYPKELGGISVSVLNQAVRDVSKAYKSNFAKQAAQRARGETPKPFRVKKKDPHKRSSNTFYVLAADIKASHVERPDLYRRPSKKEAARLKAGEESKLQKHRDAQPRKRQWTKLELPVAFLGGVGRGLAVVYLTRCADLRKDENGRLKLLGDVRFTCDELGRWHCVVQRRPRAVRKLRPADERKTVYCDPGVRKFLVGYSPDLAKVLTFCSGDGGIDKVMDRHLLKADAIITLLRDRKAATDFTDPAAKLAYEKLARQLTRRKLRHFLKAKNMVKELHCRVARELTAKFDTIVLPPYKTKDMAQRTRQRPDGTTERRVIRSGTVRRMLALSPYKLAQLLGHRSLVDGSELLRDGEEYTTIACSYCGRCYLVGGSKVFFCGLCCKPPFVADRDDKGASRTLAVKCLALQ